MGFELGMKKASNGLTLPSDLADRVSGSPRGPACSEFAGHPAPAIDSWFLKELDNFSASETGRTGQFRPRWLKERGLWQIQIRLANGDWSPVLIVQDHEKATKDNPRPFRPLDRRVFDDLAEASLQRRWSTGDPEKDMALYRSSKIAARAARKEEKRKEAVETILSIAKDNAGAFARVQADYEQGHHHGTRKFFPTS